MYLKPLDKASSLSLSNRSNFNLYSLNHDIGKVGFIQNLIADNLINSKTSLVLVSNADKANYLKDCLAAINLDGLCMVISDNKTIHDKDLALLRSAAKNLGESNSTAEWEILKANADKAITNLKESYDLLNNKIFGERSWRMLSAQKEHFNYHKEANLVKRNIDLQQIEFTQKEYWNMRGRIEEASNTYVNKFSLLQKVDCLSPEIYKSDHLNDKIIKLEKLINKGDSLLLSFGKLIEIISDEYSQQGLDEYEQLSAMNAALNHSLTDMLKRESDVPASQSLQGKFKSVFSSKNEASDITKLRQQVQFMCSEFTESKFFDIKIDQPDFDKLPIAGIKEIVFLADSVLKNWFQYLESFKSIKLKQLSPLNSDNHQLGILDENLKKYLQEINESQILNNKVEDNTLSLFKKIDLLETVLDQLKSGFTILTENEDYTEWKNMLAYAKPGTEKIIAALIGQPIKIWTRIFDQIFIGHLLDSNQSPRLPKNQMQLKHISETIENFRSKTEAAIKTKWHHEKTAKLLELKKENKQLYNQLVKKSNSIDLSWSKLISQSPDIIMALFPVIIVVEKAISNIKPLYYKWSECITYEWSSFADPCLLQIKGFSLKQTILESEQMSESLERKLRAYFNSNHIESQSIDGDELGKVSKTLSSMKNLEKLNTAKVLSKVILDINTDIRVFYLKNKCLISCLPDKDNSRIVENLTQFGIKEAGKIYEIKETMIDMFVDSSKQCIILTEDGLIRTEDIDSFDWQYHILQNLKTLGCTIINMWTADMEQGYAQLLDTVNQSNQVSTDAQIIPDKSASLYVA